MFSTFPAGLAVYQEADHESFQPDGLNQWFGTAKQGLRLLDDSLGSIGPDDPP